MLPSCKQVSEQLSDNLDEPLTGIKWFKLKLHLLMCRYCRLYGKQMSLTSETIGCMESQLEPSQQVKEKVKDNYRELHGKESNT